MPPKSSDSSRVQTTCADKAVRPEIVMVQYARRFDDTRGLERRRGSDGGTAAAIGRRPDCRRLPGFAARPVAAAGGSSSWVAGGDSPATGPAGDARDATPLPPIATFTRTAA